MCWVNTTHNQRAVFLRAAFKLRPIGLVPRVLRPRRWLWVSGGRHLLGEERAPVTRCAHHSQIIMVYWVRWEFSRTAHLCNGQPGRRTRSKRRRTIISCITPSHADHYFKTISQLQRQNAFFQISRGGNAKNLMRTLSRAFCAFANKQ